MTLTSTPVGAMETLGPFEVKRSSACRKDLVINCTVVGFPGVPQPPHGLWLLQQASADVEVHCGDGKATKTWPLQPAGITGTCAE